MKDFFKIFLVLCAIVSAFFYGRNYGETTTTESSEIKNLKSENFQNQNAQKELKNLKDKFQKLLDSSDLKKADEILGQIMTIFLADLSLQISNEKQKDFNDGKKLCTINALAKTEQKAEPVKTPEHEIEKPVQKNQIQNNARFKLGEFEILEARDSNEIFKALKKLEVKKIDSLLEGSLATGFQQSRKFFGEYRGSIIDVTGKVYGSIVFNIKNTPSEKNPIKGSIKIYKNGEITNNSSFTSNDVGQSAENSTAVIVDAGPDKYLQVYKIESEQKIAGYYYEVLPNRTTKTIGTFVLSRTDFVD